MREVAPKLAVLCAAGLLAAARRPEGGLAPEDVVWGYDGFVAQARESLRGDEREQRRRRTKRTAERLEDWVGKLSAAQLERVRQYSERAPLFAELRLRCLAGDFAALAAR